ncbi:MAG: 3-deoxy-manno-octulosonate cytidylyltransferase [Xanthomonadales bacterium]|nr:3-deoxy-manno-octulosonate cytidylyltransferase [Xanthomonadales bacterium]
MNDAVPRFHIVIPARLGSERLPGKPLVDIAGQPLIAHVVRRAQASGAASVAVATDNQRVVEACEPLGVRAVMTSLDHPSGSDRVNEVARAAGWDEDEIVVNLQGDEPLMPSKCLDQVAAVLADADNASVASLYEQIQRAEDVIDTNIVKVVLDEQHNALYFSRSPIPHARGVSSFEEASARNIRWLRHVGLYAFRVRALQRMCRTPPGPLELAERLEQLRILEHHGRIRMARACRDIPAGVDTPEDLERVRELLR